MRKSFFVLAVICALCIPMAVFAADETPPPPTMPPPPAAPPVLMTPSITRPVSTVNCIITSLRLISSRMIQTLAARLGLTEEDKAKVLNMLVKSEEESRPLYDAQMKAAEDYAIALAKEATTQAELQAAAEKAIKAEAEVMNGKIKTLYVLKAMLKPAQNTALTELLKQYSVQWLPREMRSMPSAPVTTPAPPKPADGGASSAP